MLLRPKYTSNLKWPNFLFHHRSKKLREDVRWLDNGTHQEFDSSTYCGIASKTSSSIDVICGKNNTIAALSAPADESLSGSVWLFITPINCAECVYCISCGWCLHFRSFWGHFPDFNFSVQTHPLQPSQRTKKLKKLREDIRFTSHRVLYIVQSYVKGVISL